MYQITSSCKDAINHYSRELYSKAFINNNEIYAGDIISYEINEGIISGSDFELGGAVASTLELKINNIHGEYNNLDLNGKEIKIFTGILLSNNSIEYVPMGTFLIDEAVKDKGIINIEASDKMLTLENYYESKLVFPTAVINIANEICKITGITLATKEFYNSNYIVDALPTGITLRDVIHDIAEIAGGFAKINRIGELEIITPGTIVATEINKDRYIDLQIKEGFYVDNLTIVENYFPVDPVPINLNILPFTSKWQGDFSIDSGDRIRLNDGKGTYETIITKQKITFNGGLRYESECTGLSEQQKSTQQISNTEKTNKRYRSEIKQLANEISQKVSSGDFEAYQKLTDKKIETSVSGIEALLSDNLIENGNFELDSSGWIKTGTMTISRNTYNKKSWANIYNNTISSSGSLTYEFNTSINKKHNFSVVIAKYSASKKLYRIRIEGYDDTNDSWNIVNEFTGETEATRDNPERLEYSFISTYEKYRVGVFKLINEAIDIYVTDFKVVIETTIVKKSEFNILEDKVETKVDVNGVKSTVEQNPHSVMTGFNGINDNFKIDANGVYLKGADGKEHLVFKNGRMYVRDINGSDFGYVGRNNWNGTNIYGMCVNMDAQTSFSVGFNDGDIYNSKFVVCNSTISPTGGTSMSPGLHMFCDLYTHDYRLIGTQKITDINHPNGSNKGTLNIWTPTTFNGWNISTGNIYAQAISCTTLTQRNSLSAFSVDSDLDMYSSDVISIENIEQLEESEKYLTTSITPNTEWCGTANIINGVASIDLPLDVQYKDYTVQLTAIGRNTVYLMHKNDDNFIVESDNDCSFDFIVKFENIERTYARSLCEGTNKQALICPDEAKEKENVEIPLNLISGYDEVIPYWQLYTI